MTRSISKLFLFVACLLASAASNDAAVLRPNAVVATAIFTAATASTRSLGFARAEEEEEFSSSDWEVVEEGDSEDEDEDYAHDGEEDDDDDDDDEMGDEF